MYTLFVNSLLAVAAVTANIVREQPDAGGQTLISHGTITLPGVVPWHVGLFHPKDHSYVNFCGGTLVSTLHVITAAHCVADVSQPQHLRLNITDFKVTLSKFNSAWDVEGYNIQRINVAQIIIHPHYRGHDRSFEFDIAVMQLASEVSITDSVEIALVDFENRLTDVQEANGSRGWVAGWGRTEDGTLSKYLRSIELPYVDPIFCFDSLTSDLRRYVTNDKFCAGFMNKNRSVCDGDSGGGLMFLDLPSNKYYLRGVVSVAFRPPGHPSNVCYDQHFTAFTRVNDKKTLNWLTTLIPTQCGRREVRQMTVAGVTMTSDQPWRINIYWRESPTDRWGYWTTGTLISPTHIVTSAWRFTYNNGTARATSGFRLVAGKHLGAYDVTESDTQERGVTSLNVHEQYNRNSYVHNIAVLVAHAPFTFTRAVNSACVDWTGLLQAPAPSQHVLTYGQRHGLVLAQPAAMLPPVECRTEAREDRRRFISDDDICAKTPGNNTCEGVYGAGLIMQRDNRFYLLGVRRALLAWTDTDGCHTERLYSFSSVTSHSSWLRRFIDSIKQQQPAV